MFALDGCTVQMCTIRWCMKVYECLFVCDRACMCRVRHCFPSELYLGIVKQHLDHVILIEHVSKANANVLLLGRVAVLLRWPILSTQW